MNQAPTVGSRAERVAVESVQLHAARGPHGVPSGKATAQHKDAHGDCRAAAA